MLVTIKIMFAPEEYFSDPRKTFVEGFGMHPVTEAADEFLGAATVGERHQWNFRPMYNLWKKLTGSESGWGGVLTIVLDIHQKHKKQPKMLKSEVAKVLIENGLEKESVAKYAELLAITAEAEERVNNHHIKKAKLLLLNQE